MRIQFRFMYSQKWKCAALFFQNRIIMFCLPIFTFMYLWAVYIFPGSVCLFCCSQMGRPILEIYKSLTDESRNWEWDRAVLLGIHKSDFRYSVEDYKADYIHGPESRVPEVLKYWTKYTCKKQGLLQVWSTCQQKLGIPKVIEHLLPITFFID